MHRPKRLRTGNSGGRGAFVEEKMDNLEPYLMRNSLNSTSNDC